MYEFKRLTNGFNYVFEKTLSGNKTILLKMPPISANKRGINDIGFCAENGVSLYSTISSEPDDDTAIWQEIQPFDEVNKTTSFIKIVNTSAENKRVNIRVILN